MAKVEEIGLFAGKLWNYLGEQEKVSLTTLESHFDEPKELIYQSLGWLARENKVVLESSGKTEYVLLAPQEQSLFRSTKSQSPKSQKAPSQAAYF